MRKASLICSSPVSPHPSLSAFLSSIDILNELFPYKIGSIPGALWLYRFFVCSYSGLLYKDSKLFLHHKFYHFHEQYGMPTKSVVTFWEYFNMQPSVLEIFHTFIFNIKWMIESAFYSKQAILHCARIKSQLQHWLTTGNAFFMRNQLQTIGTIVLLTHIQFKKFPPRKAYICAYPRCILMFIHCIKKEQYFNLHFYLARN